MIKILLTVTLTILLCSCALQKELPQAQDSSRIDTWCVALIGQCVINDHTTGADQSGTTGEHTSVNGSSEINSEASNKIKMIP